MMMEDKKKINGVQTRRQVYTHSKSYYIFNAPKKIKVREPKKKSKEISILKENVKEPKKTGKRIQKKESPKREKPKNKRKISKPVTIPETRLTEPKKRSLLRRIMLQGKYNRGAYDYIEDEYDDLTREELREYKNSSKRIDRRYYKEVQEYEDAYEDVTVRKGWMTFKIGLATIMLCTSIGLVHHTIQDIHDNAPQTAIVVTLQDASEEQIENAKSEMSALKLESEYKFENLTPDEQIDAALRLPIVESRIPEGRFKNSILNFADQELLDSIVQEAFEEDYESFSDEKKFDLRQLAYELLDENNQTWIRSPQKLAELKVQQEAERIEREKNRAEVEARLNAKKQAIQEDDMELE